MAAIGFSGLEMGNDEWVRQSWPARRHRESEDSGQSWSEGMLTLTNRRLLFTGRSELDEVLTFDFEEFLVVRRERHGVFSNFLIIETPSGQRFGFRAKKLACKQIEARSQMRQVATSRASVLRFGSTGERSRAYGSTLSISPLEVDGGPIFATAQSQSTQ